MDNEKYQISERWSQGKGPLKTFDTNRQPTEHELSYWKKVHEKPVLDLSGIAESIISSKPTFIPYPLDATAIYDTFMSIAETKIGITFAADPNYNQSIMKIAKYFSGISKDFPPTKGLFIYGKVGTGKSEAMKVFQSLIAEIERRLRNSNTPYTPRYFKIKSCIELVETMKANKNSDMVVELLEGTVLFDDAGYEDTQLKVYGNETNFMQTILSGRYDRLRAKGLVTHITTNYTPEQLGDMYGERVKDRINEMFIPVEFTGKSYRGSIS